MISSLLKTVPTKKFGLIASSMFVVGYLIYFDYIRRHDPVFREKLEKEKREIYKHHKRAMDESTPREIENLENTGFDAQKMNNPIYIQQKLGEGEYYAQQGPEYYGKAADSFAQSVCNSPNPLFTMAILEKHLPPELYSLLKMKLTDILSTFEYQNFS